jgi:predicted aminopeptidase
MRIREWRHSGEVRIASASGFSADVTFASRRVDQPIAPTAPLWREWRRRLHGARRIALALLTLVVVLVVAFPTGRYLIRAAWEEMRILAGRRLITSVIRDPATDSITRTKLRVVLAARAFAADSVGLNVGDSFTSYTRLKRDTLVLLVQGAYRDRLARYTWWFPIVGRVPYKGYFDYDAARREGERLKRYGLDVYLRPASAFSTLGFFDDPILSTTLGEDSLELANTVVHETLHNTIYLPGQAVFNESFANFVGARGAAWFFRSRAATGGAEETDARWSDTKLLGRFWAALYATVDSAYKAHPNDKAARIAARDSISVRARIELVETLGPQLRTVGPRALERVRLDNAALLARRVYMTDLDLFDTVYERENWDVRRAIARIRTLARASPKDPYGAVKRWLALPRKVAAEQRTEIE